MKRNLPLIISVGGCIFFGLSSIYILHNASNALDNLLGLNLNMVFSSYRKGCLDNSKNKEQCLEKAKLHAKDIKDIYDKMDNM